MQLLNSKISLDFKNTIYRQQKAQDYYILCFFCFVAFSYYKDGGSETYIKDKPRLRFIYNTTKK